MVKSKHQQETEFYAIKIVGWEVEYGLNFGPDRHKHDLDIETNNLSCAGEFVYPPKIAGRKLDVRFYTSRYITKNLNDNESKYNDIKSLGGLQVWGFENNYFITYIPHDVMPTLIGALTAKKFSHITMFGNRLYRGHASIQRFKFESDFSLSDWE